jgi:DNA repair exonuclease SbcCD ATPase subunit
MVLAQLTSIIEEGRTLAQDLAYKETKVEEFTSAINILENKRALILLSKEYHKKAIDKRYLGAIKELETLINDVVAAIFYDRNYSIEMDLTDTRSKSLVWYLWDQDKGIQMSIKNGVGRGIRTILSFILQSYYVLSSGSKYLFIDEGYHYISEAYVGNFFEFAKVLCEQRGLALVMISHDDRFLSYCDKRYSVSDGFVEEHK